MNVEPAAMDSLSFQPRKKPRLAAKSTAPVHAALSTETQSMNENETLQPTASTSGAPAEVDPALPTASISTGDVSAEDSADRLASILFAVESAMSLWGLSRHPDLKERVISSSDGCWSFDACSSCAKLRSA